MTTVAEFKAVFPITNAQLVKAAEWIGEIAPRLDANGNPLPATLDDLIAYMWKDINVKYINWKRAQGSVEF